MIIEAGLSSPPHHTLFVQRDTFRQRVGGADRFLLDDDRRRIDVSGIQSFVRSIRKIQGYTS